MIFTVILDGKYYIVRNQSMLLLLVPALERHIHSVLIQCEGGVGIHLIVVGTTTFLDRVCSEFTLKCRNIPTLGSLFDQLLHD